MDIQLDDTSIGEKVLIWFGISLPFILINAIISLGWIFGPPAASFIHIISLLTLLPCALLYENEDYKKFFVRVSQRIKYRLKISNIKEKSLHEVYPDIIKWKDGDSVDVVYFNEKGKIKTENCEFASISGSNSVIFKSNYYYGNEYFELFLKDIIKVKNTSYEKREKEKRTKQLKEKAKENTEYEKFLHEREEALDEIRQINYENREKLDNDI